MKGKDTVRVGAGAGTSDDRMVPALELAERGDIDYLVFEFLAERTVARENLARTKDPNKGYTPSLHERLRMVLPTCIKKRTSASSATWEPPIRPGVPVQRAGKRKNWDWATYAWP